MSVRRLDVSRRTSAMCLGGCDSFMRRSDQMHTLPIVCDMLAV